MSKRKIIAPVTVLLFAAGCATVITEQEKAAKAFAVMKASFKDRGQAKVERLNQDEAQALCSRSAVTGLAKDVAQKIEADNLKTIVFPASGKLMGDWKEGEKIAQSGIGKQFSDDPSRPSGGNCYACHQLSKQELSYGTIGPSLYNFGKLRGVSEAIQKYTYGKIYNAQAYSACSNMPRFGHNKILTESQIQDVVALLLAPDSPVNK